MKILLTAGMMLVSILLTLSVGVAFAEKENATNNMSLSENIAIHKTANMPTTMNTISIQNNSWNIILIKNMTEIINMIMPENMNIVTENMTGLQNITSSPL